MRASVVRESPIEKARFQLIFKNRLGLAGEGARKGGFFWKAQYSRCAEMKTSVISSKGSKWLGCQPGWCRSVLKNTGKEGGWESWGKAMESPEDQPEDSGLTFPEQWGGSVWCFIWHGLWMGRDRRWGHWLETADDQIWEWRTMSGQRREGKGITGINNSRIFALGNREWLEEFPPIDVL